MNENLIIKLEELEKRYIELDGQLQDPNINCISSKVIVISKEQGKLRPIVEKFHQFKKINSEIEQAKQMLKDDSADREMKELVQAELEELEKQHEAMTTEMINSLVMADDDAIDSVIMEIRAGTGGEEAALFARDLYEMYTRYAVIKGWKYEDMDFSTTDRGGFREVVFNIKGAGVWSELGYESGAHRVQRVPETEAQGRIHTSAATVAVLPEPEEVDIQISPNDVIENVCRAGGPGGQNVNKVSSAIRLEHIPTGITVNMREDKSQHKNRAKAWRLMRSRVYEYYASQKRAERDQKRKTMIGSGDRSEKIRTYNFPQNRMTDHRINFSLYNLDKVLTGELKDMVAALKQHDIEERIKNL